MDMEVDKRFLVDNEICITVSVVRDNNGQLENIKSDCFSPELFYAPPAPRQALWGYCPAAYQ